MATRDVHAKEKAINNTAKAISEQVRAHVRDGFVPGSLLHLDEVEKLVYVLTRQAMLVSHDQYTCGACGDPVVVVRVRCSKCCASNNEMETGR